MSCVRPGVFDTRAKLLRLHTAFNNADFPTFDLPTNAISALDSGNWSTLVAESTNDICIGLVTAQGYEPWRPKVATW
jgi:hypothetical protein